MKKRKIIPITLSLSLLLTGCSGITSKVEDTVKDNIGASALTVQDIKKKYGTEDKPAIMPMYNVESTREFNFTFQHEIGDLMPTDMISVHTDIKALPESEIFTFVSEDYQVGDKKATLTVKPGMSVLQSEKDKNSDKTTWGNAPIYYIRINYDLESKTPKKLDEPIIVPFTIKSELPVPNLRKEISPDGKLKLVWDKVEGAKEYKIYNVSKITLLETTNEELSGAETGYKGFPRLEATVTETQFNDFSGFGNGSLNEYQGNISGQNYGVNGDYYVTAVSGDKESNFSVPVSTPKLSSQLPKDMEDKISFTNYGSVKDLPKSIKVEFIDGSFQNRDVIYDFEHADVQENGATEVRFTVKGTAFSSYVEVENMKKTDESPSVEKEDPNTGLIEAKNDTDNVPKPNVPTIIEKSKDDKKESKPSDTKKQTESKESTKSEEPSKAEAPVTEEKPVKEEPVASEEPKEETPAETTNDIVAEQQENTKEHVEEGNKEEVSVPEVAKDLEINAKSALEEYLALKLIGAEKEISLEAFPEAQNFTTIEDAFKKVIYQNPLILGVNRYGYDYSTLTLYVEYDESADVIKKKQEEIKKEAQKIVSSVVKSSMSDEEKRLALYDYLNDNTKYDDEALKAGEASGFKDVDVAFTDSFTTYGIMVEKVGVCQSYAMTYKMLLDLSGVESIVVTGTLDGVPHAWNKVKIDNEWLHTDNTNNETNVGIPYMVYQSNDSTVEAVNYDVNNDYWIDGELGKFAGKTDKYDYYVAKKLEVKDLNQLKAELTKQIKAGDDEIVIRVATVFDNNSLMNAVGEIVQKEAPDKLYSTRFGMLNDKYFMVMLK
jgi:Transglutaminase-like superfamily